MYFAQKNRQPEYSGCLYKLQVIKDRHLPCETEDQLSFDIPEENITQIPGCQKSVEKSADTDNVHEIGSGSRDSMTLILGVDDHAVSHIQSYMAVIADDISGTCLFQ